MNMKGSYSLDLLNDTKQELERLQAQANTMKSLEVKLLKQAGLKPNHSVLEFGCGPGFVTPTLCELANQGKVISIDNDEKLLRICAEKIKNPPALGFLTLNNSNTSYLESLDSTIDFSYLRFVLQHIENKQEALKQVHQCLKKNGIVCVVDSDDGLVLQFPQDEFINSLLLEAQDLQKKRGGDRLVGRKIPSLLADLGFSKIKSQVIMFTSDDIPFESLAKLLFGFKADLVGKTGELNEWINKKVIHTSSRKYFLSGGIVLVTAEK
ncbi:MAG: methyltransferase domain-containing protein [Bdellovibrionaceae bacterium]|nr:methyltransferase domain-containing protein [Pseudobdellovibrionaceae bacterium]